MSALIGPSCEHMATVNTLSVAGDPGSVWGQARTCSLQGKQAYKATSGGVVLVVVSDNDDGYNEHHDEVGNDSPSPQGLARW